MADDSVLSPEERARLLAGMAAAIPVERISAVLFERQYAERSGVTVEQLRALGRIVIPCDCGEDICQGWACVTKEAWRRVADLEAKR